MNGFRASLERATPGIRIIVNGAPVDKFFTQDLWADYKPSEDALRRAVKAGYIELIEGFNKPVYKLTPSGKALGEFLRAEEVVYA